jgi:hypothetical protein
MHSLTGEPTVSLAPEVWATGTENFFLMGVNGWSARPEIRVRQAIEEEQQQTKGGSKIWRSRIGAVGLDRQVHE